MPRQPQRSSKKASDHSPVDHKQREVREREAKLRAELERTRRFLEEAPKKKAEAEQKRREELLARASRVGRIDGPTDIRYNGVMAQAQRPRKLRRERNHDQLLFIFLLIAFAVVIYYACNVLMHG